MRSSWPSAWQWRAPMTALIRAQMSIFDAFSVRTLASQATSQATSQAQTRARTHAQTQARLLALKKPTYDTKLLKKSPDLFQQSVERRRVKLPGGISISEIQKELEVVSNMQAQKNELIHERNTIQKSMAGKLHTNTEDSDSGTLQLRKQLNSLKADIKRCEDVLALRLAEVAEHLESIPNLVSPDSLIESEQVVDTVNADMLSQLPASEMRDHVSIGKKLRLFDLENASNVAGSSAYYLIGDGALLEQALVQYALKKARKAGWSMITPPSMVRKEFTTACGFKPRDQNNEQQVYTIEDSDLCLTGTAEIPLAGWAAGKTLGNLQTVPIKKVGVSRSYRAEAGARGRDTKGLYRVHEFTKVELFAWVSTREKAENMLEEILAFEKSIIEDLGLTARVLNMPPHELGAPAYKKYDIEAWMPGRGDWGEVTSASNCLEYQSRRLHTRYTKTDGPKTTLEWVQTLNGTAMAVPRMIIAILETHYDPELNRVRIPEVLRCYMDDKEYIG